MRRYIVEVVIGIGLAAVVLGFLAGLDLTPLLLGGGFAVLLKLALDGRAPLGRPFEAISARQSKGVLPQVTFADVGGQDAAKRELMEALAFLKRDSLSKKLGIRPVKGHSLSRTAGDRKNPDGKGGSQLH